MVDTTFVSQETVIEAAWCNDVNNMIYTVLNNVQTREELQELLRGVESTAWNPGYDFVYVDGDTFRVDGFDVTNLYHAGRRVQFTVGSTSIYGVITSSSFSTNTTIEMTMETYDLSDVAYNVYFVSSNTNWSPISADPMSGDKINDISTGWLAGTSYWIIVGDEGRAFYSINAGIDWTAITTGTTENLNCVSFEPETEKFLIGGDNRTLLLSEDGTTVTALNPSPTASDDNFVALEFNGNDHVWWLKWWDTSGFHYGAVSVGIYDVNLNIFTSTITKHGLNGPAEGMMLCPENGGASYGMEATPVNTIGYTDHTDTTPATLHTWTNSGDITAQRGEYFITPMRNQALVGTDAGIIISAPLLGGAAAYDTTSLAGTQLNAFSHSNVHERVVVVGNTGMIGYISETDMMTLSDGDFTIVPSGLEVTANFTAIDRSDMDGVFIAVADNGQICRSTNGTS